MTSDNLTASQAADLLVMAAPELIETRDEDGFTPLHLAVIAGNMPLVTFLLANNADVEAVDSEKHTVVHWATGNKLVKLKIHPPPYANYPSKVFFFFWKSGGSDSTRVCIKSAS